MGKLLVKDGVDFGTVLAPAGARILEELKGLVPSYSFDVVITSARDGVHSGPADPHYSGEAYDLRTNTLTDSQKQQLLSDLQTALYHTERRFYAFIEAPGTPNEHLHVQRRNDTIYTVLDYLANL